MDYGHAQVTYQALKTSAWSTVTVEREHRNAIHSNNNDKHNSEKTTNVQLEVEKVNVVLKDEQDMQFQARK